MKTTLSTHEIATALKNDSNAAWSYAGAKALAEYLEQLEEDTGAEMELDVVAIRCDFSEFKSLRKWAVEYFGGKKEMSDEFSHVCGKELDNAIRQYIRDRGDLIEFDGGIIVSLF